MRNYRLWLNPWSKWQRWTLPCVIRRRPGRRDFVAAEVEAFTGDSEALVATSLLPIDRQHPAALQMFARGQINRKDLVTIKDLIGAAGSTARIEALKAENERLFRELEDATDGTVINGRAN